MLILIAFTLLLLSASGFGYLLYIGERPIQLPVSVSTNTITSQASGPSLGARKLILEIPQGQTLRDFSRSLFRLGWVPEPWSIRIWAALDWPGKPIRAGEYAIGIHDSIRRILWTVINGRVIRYQLTIPEGRTFRQLLAILSESPHLKHELENQSDAQIMRHLGHQGELPEGRFFPDTYDYTAGMNSLTVLRMAYNRMQAILQQLWPTRHADVTLKTSYEALILASIIEKETAVAAERPIISAVFHNRLKRGMRLQTDPTVIYGMGLKYKGNLTRKNLRQDTAYNTYTRFGLPPTPIALPGKLSIVAALQPAQSEALYFVAIGDGRHYFSNTLGEHKRAVDRFQRHRIKHLAVKRS